MLESLFGGHGKGNNDIFLIVIIFLLFNSFKDDRHDGGKGGLFGGIDGLFGGNDGLFGGNNIIWIIAILFLLGGGDIFGLGEAQ